MERNINAFISYSRKDMGFARKVDSALVLHGVPTFLDERDVVGGDSIPGRVYGSLSSATHVILVLSPNSVASRWVADELAHATMRRNSGECKVLPVLVRRCELPSAIRHIQYIRFIGWRQDKQFHAGMRALLRSLGVTPREWTRFEGLLFLRHWRELRRAEIAAATLSGAIRAAGDAAHMSPVANYKHSQFEGLRIVLKWSYDDDAQQVAAAFIDLARVLRRYQGETTTDTIASSLNDLVELLRSLSHPIHRPQNGYELAEQARVLASQAGRLAEMLGLVQENSLSLLVSGIEA